nr:Gag-Pol polyprotein [Tanacetum cinerariifolium]
MSFEEIEAKFTQVWKRIEDFTPMGSKEEAERAKRQGIILERSKLRNKNYQRKLLSLKHPLKKSRSYVYDVWTDKTPSVEISVSPAPVVLVPVNSAGTPSSTTIDQDAPSPSQSSSSPTLQSLSLLQGVVAESTIMKDNPFAPIDSDPFVNMFAPEPHFEVSSSGDVSSTESTYVTQTHYHLGKWIKDHPLDNVNDNPSLQLSTRKQLATDALWCFYNSVLLKVEPKNFKSAITKDCWFQAMQDEIHEFDQL